MTSTFKNQALSIVDISSLEEDTSPDMTNDTTIIYDKSLAATNKIALENLGHSYKTLLLAGDVSTSSNTVYSDITDLQMSILPGNIYKIQLYCFGIAAATTTGVRVRILFTSNNVLGAADGNATIISTTSSTIAYNTCDRIAQSMTSGALSTYSTTVPSLTKVSTVIAVLGTSTLTATPQLISEVSGSSVTVKAGSCVVYQNIGRVGSL